MKIKFPQTIALILLFNLLSAPLSFAAYNLEVPVEPWDEYRQQFKIYSKHLLLSYDRAFVDDYEGAIREVEKAIDLLPDEGLGFAERSKYYRILQNSAQADSDLNEAVKLFNQAIDKYATGNKNKLKGSRLVSTHDSERLIATIKYQRGEAYFNSEQYGKANVDFAAGCQGGNPAACSRIWDVKAIEKRGVNWVPLTSRQYYNRRSIEFPSLSTVRVWVRREEFQAVQSDSSLESYVQQHLELNCSTKEFRLIEAQVSSKGDKSTSEKISGSTFTKPTPGSGPAKLMITLCPQSRQK
ncbi:MAG: hypothetical protein PHN84_07340 [Desulfuromonadaceae bacterium]|nr:hypothetical protein [Desulfuromonadaceae bacterium]MDD2854625.1 hypothetical protein [Desulfuromonadaceae bacterium]